MRTLGIDLATEHGSTGVCEIEWRRGQTPLITNLTKGSGVTGMLDCPYLADRMMKVLDKGGWVGIDAPFGFPNAFTTAVRAWTSKRGRVEIQADSPPSGLPPLVSERWDPINRRVTDAHVSKRLHDLKNRPACAGSWSTWPLSSVVERITPTTVRCAELISLTGRVPPDRIGFNARIIETYPIAALRIWLCRHPAAWRSLTSWDDGTTTRPGYKKDDRSGSAARADLAASLKSQLGLRFARGVSVAELKDHHDLIDALVCAMVARLAASGDRPTAIPTELLQHEPVIEREGWIHLPPANARLDNLRQAD